MLTKQGNKIIPGSKEAVWEIWKRQEAVPPPPLAMINSEQRLTFFLKLCNLCNCLLQPPGRINNDSRKQTSRYVQTLCRPKVEEIPPVHQISPTASQIITTGAQEPVFSALCHLVSKLPHLQLFTQPAFLQNAPGVGGNL